MAPTKMWSSALARSSGSWWTGPASSPGSGRSRQTPTVVGRTRPPTNSPIWPAPPIRTARGGRARLHAGGGARGDVLRVGGDVDQVWHAADEPAAQGPP